jgi:RNA polymerase sigma factor (TIGR02999 family)
MSTSVRDCDHPDILVERLNQGDREAMNKLIEMFYPELIQVASYLLRPWRKEYVSFSPEEVVAEAVIRLLRYRGNLLHNYCHFKGRCVEAVKSAVLDNVRREASTKRGNDRQKMSLEEIDQLAWCQPDELIFLSDALEKFELAHARQSTVVMLRYFVGLTENEIAEVLGVNKATVGRDWQVAKDWLRRELSADYSRYSNR